MRWDFEKKTPRDEAVLAAMANRKSGGGGAADPAAIGHEAHARQIPERRRRSARALQRRSTGRKGGGA